MLPNTGDQTTWVSCILLHWQTDSSPLAPPRADLSTLAWKIPYGQRRGILVGYRIRSPVEHDCDFPHFHSCIEEEMAALQVFLPGESGMKGSLMHVYKCAQEWDMTDDLAAAPPQEACAS